MTEKHINREIAEETFEYGNHVITVSVRLKYTNQYNSQHDIMNSVEGYHYYRFVRVKANRKGNEGSWTGEVEKTCSAAVDVEGEVKDHWLFGQVTKGTPVPPIPDHVEYAVRPVLEELDELYEYTAEDTEIDVDVALHRVEHETSWVEVDDEVERISKEIDSMTEATE